MVPLFVLILIAAVLWRQRHRPTAKRLFVEPMLAPLARKYFAQHGDLCGYVFGIDRNVEIRLDNISIPLRNFVLPDLMSTKGVPG